MSSDIRMEPNARIPESNRVVSQNLEERLMIARLFGRPVPETEQGNSVTRMPETRGLSVPHLGQNVDLLA